MTRTPLVIDIYRGDKVVSFADAYAAGYRAVIHKATQGTTIIDKTYASRWVMAAKAGMLWGAYHFLSHADPAKQAARFLDVAQPDAQTLMAVDHEEQSDGSAVPLASMIAFVEAVEVAIGRRVVIYSGSVIKAQVRKASAAQKQFLAARRLWLSHYSAKPKWPPLWSEPWLIQFTGDGTGPEPHRVPGVPGSKGFCDISSFDGTGEELAAQWAAVTG
jgi:GH25 family lysozyme M1 (1,4-beta-N-acetylmuramidase)